MFVQSVLMASRSARVIFGSVCVHDVVFLRCDVVQATSSLDFGVQFVNLLPEPIAQLHPFGLQRRRQQPVLDGKELGLQSNVPHLHRIQFGHKKMLLKLETMRNPHYLCRVFSE